MPEEMNAVVKLYYRPAGYEGSSQEGAIGSQRAPDKWSKWTPDTGHVFLEVEDKTSGRHASFDYWPEKGSGSPHPVTNDEGKGDWRRGEHFMLSIPISADQAKKMVQAIDERWRNSPDHYDLTKNSCVTGVEHILQRGGLNIPDTWIGKPPMTPEGLWKVVENVARQTPGSEYRGPVSSDEHNFSNIPLNDKFEADKDFTIPEGHNVTPGDANMTDEYGNAVHAFQPSERFQSFQPPEEPLNKNAPKEGSQQEGGHNSTPTNREPNQTSSDGREIYVPPNRETSPSSLDTHQAPLSADGKQLSTLVDRDQNFSLVDFSAAQVNQSLTPELNQSIQPQELNQSIQPSELNQSTTPSEVNQSNQSQEIKQSLASPDSGNDANKSNTSGYDVSSYQATGYDSGSSNAGGYDGGNSDAGSYDGGYSDAGGYDAGSSEGGGASEGGAEAASSPG